MHVATLSPLRRVRRLGITTWSTVCSRVLILHARITTWSKAPQCFFRPAKASSAATTPSPSAPAWLCTALAAIRMAGPSGRARALTSRKARARLLPSSSRQAPRHGPMPDSSIMDHREEPMLCPSTIETKVTAHELSCSMQPMRSRCLSCHPFPHITDAAFPTTLWQGGSTSQIESAGACGRARGYDAGLRLPDSSSFDLSMAVDGRTSCKPLEVKSPRSAPGVSPRSNSTSWPHHARVAVCLLICSYAPGRDGRYIWTLMRSKRRNNSSDAQMTMRRVSPRWRRKRGGRWLDCDGSTKMKASGVECRSEICNSNPKALLWVAPQISRDERAYSPSPSACNALAAECATVAQRTGSVAAGQTRTAIGSEPVHLRQCREPCCPLASD